MLQGGTRAPQVPKEAQIVEAYLSVDMALFQDRLSEPAAKAGVQVFILGIVDMIRQVKSMGWPESLTIYESVLSNHGLLPALPVNEFVDEIGKAAASDPNVESLVRQGAQSISMYVGERDANAAMDLMGVPLFVEKHASSFAPLYSPSGTSETCSSKEHQCMRLASDAKREIDKRRLGELYTQRFENPLSGVALWPKGDKKLSGSLLLPIAWVLIIVLAIFVPAMYVLHRIELRKEASALRKKICDPSDATEVKPPDTKTLEALWESCGLPGGLGLDESSALVSNWLSVLYGKKVADSVGAEARARQIAREQIEANRPYYDGDEDAAHFYFALPIESLVRELTDELPPYSEQT